MRTKALPFMKLSIVAAACSLALLAGCTDDSAWQSEPGGRATTTKIPQGGSVTLASLNNCEPDLERMQESRRAFFNADEESEVPVKSDIAATRGSDGSEAKAAPQSTMALQSGAEGLAASEASRDAASPSENQDKATDDDIVGTNVQEAGVDEADVIKTDGKVIVALGDGYLYLIKIDDNPGIDGKVSVPASSQESDMYLLGDKVFIVDANSYTESGSPLTSLTEVDVSDPESPRLVKSVGVSGEMVSSRSVGDSVHLVLTSYSADVLPMIMEADGSGTEKQLGGCGDVLVEAVVDANGKTVQSMVAPEPTGGQTITVVSFKSLEQGLKPTVIEGTGGVVYGSADSIYVASPQWERGADSTAIHRFELSDGASEYVATGMVTGQLLNQFSMSEYDAVLRVVTTGSGIGIADDMPAVDDDMSDGVVNDGVVSSGATEPGSTGDATDATEPAIAPRVRETVAPETTTIVEKPAPPMTTVSEPGAPDILIAPAPPSASSTRLTTLGIADMKELGQVSGLAPGETVRSSRFIGPMAYVVTFRQTDPLFAIDVSDPSSPKVLGELKIPGFSEYLHPVGDGLLLGVGRDVDPVSQIDKGLKLSLFDVSDPKAPVEVDTWTRPDSYSPVAQNHHAFTWDAKRNRAIVPVEGGCSDNQPLARRSVTSSVDPDRSVSSPPSNATAGITAEEYMAQKTCNFAMVFDVSDARITEVASFSHPYPGSKQDSATFGGALPDRSLIIGSVLWSRSVIGLGYSPVSDPANVTLIPFG